MRRRARLRFIARKTRPQKASPMLKLFERMVLLWRDNGTGQRGAVFFLDAGVR